MIRTALLALALVVCAAGCNLFNQHAQMMDAMRGAISETSRRLGDSSVGQYAGGAQIIDPGIEIEAGMKYFAVARYRGLAGQITASAQGTLTRELPPEAVSELGQIYRNTTITDAERAAMIERFFDKWLARKATQPATE